MKKEEDFQDCELSERGCHLSTVYLLLLVYFTAFIMFYSGNTFGNPQEETMCCCVERVSEVRGQGANAKAALISTC